MNPSQRSYLHLMLLVAVGLGCALFSGIDPIPIPQGDQRPNRFVISGQTARTSPVALFFDWGYEIYPSQVSIQYLHPSVRPVTLSFPLPSGKLYRLRFDPTYSNLPTRWQDAQIQDADGRVLRRFEPSDFIKMNQVASLVIADRTLTIVPTREAFNPMVLLRLTVPVRLPDQASGVPSVPSPGLRTEGFIALALALMGLALAGLVRREQSRNRAPWSARPARWLETLGLIFAAVSVLNLRRPSLLVDPQMFVEDGVIFFHEQWVAGWKAVLIPYSGYLHLIPRLTAGLGHYFPTAWVPRIYGTVAVLAIVATVLKAASPRVAFPFVYGCALTVLLVPNSDEITAFLTNVHWWGAIILVLIGVSAPPRSRGELARDLLAVLFVGLSGPWAILLTPLFIARVWWRPTAGSGATLALLLLTAGVQLHFGNSSLPSFAAADWAGHIRLGLAGLGYRLGGQLAGYLPNFYWAVASSNVTNIPVLPWELWALAGWLILLIAIPVPAKHRRMRWSFIFVAVVVVASTAVRTKGWEYDLFSLPVCQRYVFLPLLLTFWLLVMALDRPGWRRWLVAALVAVIIGRNLDYFRMPSLQDFPWARYAEQIDQGRAVTVPIYPAGWTVEFKEKNSRK